MGLKLNNLQSIVQRIVEEEKILFALKEEVTRSLGPSILTENREIESICDDAMDRLDIVERQGVRHGKFEPSLAVKMLEHKSPRVRRLAARLAPTTQLHKVKFDKSPAVRSEVAKRVDLSDLKEMMKRYPSDDNLIFIFEAREDDDDEFDMYGDDRLGDIVKQQDEQELTDLWYESLARKMVHDYEHTTEGTWKHTAVAQYVSAVKATSGVEIDPEKLLESIEEVIAEIEEEKFSTDTLSNIAFKLDRQAFMESKQFTMGDDTQDIVNDLMNSQLSQAEYIARAQDVFSVTHGGLPRPVMRLAVTEGVEATTIVPVSGELPHDEGFRALDEQALDLYVETWNKKREREGNPLRISWTGSADDKIFFDVRVI